ncbi:hypothetical protein D3C79_775040 [compost metagenome]
MDPQRVQFGNRLFGVAAQRIAQRQQADRHAVFQYHHRRFTGVFQLFHLVLQLCVELACRQFTRRADQQGFAVNLAFHPDPSQSATCLSRRQRCAILLGPFDNCLRQRVVGAGFYRRRQGQQPLLADAVAWQHIRNPGFTFRQRAGFIEGDGLHLAQLFQRCAAFNQGAASGGCRQPGGNRRRSGYDQRTRTAYQQQSQATVNPDIPRL